MSFTEPDKNVPIAQMGNYQDYLKNMAPPLRDIDESNKLFDRPMFGNPFAKKVGCLFAILISFITP